MLILWSFFGIGCGTKNEREVAELLQERRKDLPSYRSQGTMTLQMGEDPLTYDIEVWYQKPYFYRVHLQNVQRGISQIILRNQTGVFVLTPQLRQSFRFRNDWPRSPGQVYLYETIIQSIIQDEQRIYQSKDKGYEFDVVANYSVFPQLTRQKIWLDKELKPRKIEIRDESQMVRLQVSFRSFEEDVSFDKNAFDKEWNMAGVAKETWLGDFVPLGPLTVYGGGMRVQPLSSADLDTLWGRAYVTRYGRKGEGVFLTLTQYRDMPVHEFYLQGGLPVWVGGQLAVSSRQGPYHRLTWTEGRFVYDMVSSSSWQGLQEIVRDVHFHGKTVIPGSFY